VSNEAPKGVSRETAGRRSVNDSFTNAEVVKDFFKHIFNIDTAGQSTKRGRGMAEFFRDQFLARARRYNLRQRPVQSGDGLFQQMAMPGPRYDRALTGRKLFFGELGQSTTKGVEPFPAFG
jgi:hypothetical protein